MIEVNNKNCSTAVKGTGVSKCQIDIKYISMILLFEKGLSFDKQTFTFTDESIEALIKKGQILVLPMHDNIEDNGEENVYETLTSGAKRFVRYGLYEYKLNYAEGICFGNALSTLNSKKWDVAFVDVENKIILNDNGLELKGFGTFLTQNENIKLNDGSTATKNALRVQLNSAGTEAMNESIAVVFESDSIDWSALNGIIDAKLRAESTSAANLVLSVLDGCSATGVVGITDFRFLNSSGNAATHTLVDNGDGTYNVSGLSAGTYTVSFWDNDNQVNVVADSIGDLYKAGSLTLTVV